MLPRKYRWFLRRRRSPQEAVFILGVSQRSGTNYLFDLITMHPQCCAVQDVWEDFLFANVADLKRFADSVSQCWKPGWDRGGKFRDMLMKHLTHSWVSFLAELTQRSAAPSTRYLVTKTPSVKNLEIAWTVPNARVLVLIRDGRSVVASAMKSFGRSIEDASAGFAEGARQILTAQSKGVPFLLVKYESLMNHPHEELTRIFDYLEIKAKKYDFRKAASLPVRGSSHFGKVADGVHWDPIKKTSDFDPMNQWQSWNETERTKFDAIAGTENALLGYSLASAPRQTLDIPNVDLPSAEQNPSPLQPR